jgi:hypothetical protein
MQRPQIGMNPCSTGKSRGASEDFVKKSLRNLEDLAFNLASRHDVEESRGVLRLHSSPILAERASRNRHNLVARLASWMNLEETLRVSRFNQLAVMAKKNRLIVSAF